MKMHKEEYEKLMLKFALEMSETGVTDDMTKLVKAKIERNPNLVSVSSEEVTDRFTYRHQGYLIEAQRTVKLVVRKCN
jgi:hypothetical protein